MTESTRDRIEAFATGVIAGALYLIVTTWWLR